ncbi:MAG: hypothetical protein LC685_05415, partial [Actinobacteria bacterium]|nr:hypothetical protein [Actinomycetota bacterium]
MRSTAPLPPRALIRSIRSPSSPTSVFRKPSGVEQDLLWRDTEEQYPVFYGGDVPWVKSALRLGARLRAIDVGLGRMMALPLHGRVAGALLAAVQQ